MPIPAAQYLRMSTEHQQYSLENQAAAIKCYAEEHGFAVMQKYEDVAKSGLLLRNRPGLRAMLHDVVSRQAKFTAILVLDVTRWGRFQDIDESAHYEFLCKQAGTPVHYCSETFSNDVTLANMIIKTLKRSMAAEYSRELSAKVAAGHRRVASLGFRNGGIPGYGFRRLLVSSERKPKQILATGERKSLATDRVILVPGPQHEVQCVREIYRMFVEERLSTGKIASELNRRGTPLSTAARGTKRASVVSWCISSTVAATFSGNGPKSLRDRALRGQKTLGTWSRMLLSRSSAEKHSKKRSELFTAEPFSKRTRVCWMRSGRSGSRKANSPKG